MQKIKIPALLLAICTLLLLCCHQHWLTGKMDIPDLPPKAKQQTLQWKQTEAGYKNKKTKWLKKEKAEAVKLPLIKNRMSKARQKVNALITDLAGETDSAGMSHSVAEKTITALANSNAEKDSLCDSYIHIQSRMLTIKDSLLQASEGYMETFSVQHKKLITDYGLVWEQNKQYRKRLRRQKRKSGFLTVAVIGLSAMLVKGALGK